MTETDYVASDSGPGTTTSSTDTTPVYLDTSGITTLSRAGGSQPGQHHLWHPAGNSQLQGIATVAVTGEHPRHLHLHQRRRQHRANAGNGQSEAVTFTPTDTIDSRPSSATVIVNVAKATPVIVSLSPVNITYGTALANSQFSGTALTPDRPCRHLHLHERRRQRAARRQRAERTGHLHSHRHHRLRGGVLDRDRERCQGHANGDSQPGQHHLGTALDNTQLSGTATSTVNGSTCNVPGTFTYTTNAGIVLNAGNGQIEAVTFTPNDTTDYVTVASSSDRQRAQSQATPTVSSTRSTSPTAPPWPTASSAAPRHIPFGGTITIVPGTFTYTTAAGIVLKRRQRPERSGHFHAQRHHELHAGIIDRDRQRRPGHADDDERQPRQHPLRHRAGQQPAQRNGKLRRREAR